MKNVLKQEKGVALISLAVVIIVIGIITTMLMYNIKDTKDVTNLATLYSDIDTLSDRVSNYYATYGKIPAREINGLDDIISTNWSSDSPVGVNDTGNFLVLDLSALQGLSLNYGWDYENIKNSSTMDETQTDLYIINEDSHNIFYLKGLEVEGKDYYTNQDKDTEKVNLKYVEGIKIFNGYNYESGNKSDGIIIASATNSSDKYRWIDLDNGEYTLSNDGTYVENDEGTITNILLISPQTYTEFVKSARQNKGFYLKQNSSGYVLYFDFIDESWSLTYDTESIYKDVNGDTAYIPKGFQVSQLANESVISEGLIIKNTVNNMKFVWIDVPDKVLKGITHVEDIERELKEYASSYRDEANYIDSWYDGCGIVDTANNDAEHNALKYENMKKEIYSNIKKKGGFWMSADEISGNVTLVAAQSNIGNINIENTTNTEIDIDVTTSLMFGIQWDLACKFINDNASGDATKLNIEKFDTNNCEWTLEFAKSGQYLNPTASNSIARGGSGGIAAHSEFNYSSNSNAYRVMLY